MSKTQLHPHTHAVQTAARHLDSMAKLLSDGPKFMETPATERAKREAALPPEVRRLKGALTQEMFDRLTKP